MKKHSVFWRPVPVSWLVALFGFLPTANPRAQIVAGGTDGVSTNVVIISGDLAPFRGNAAAAWGIVGVDAVSITDATLSSDVGGAQQAAALESGGAGGLTLGASHATVIGQGNTTASEASVANVSFTTSGGLFGGGTTITADFVISRAAASCSTDGPAFSGQTQVSGLVVDGEAVAVTGEANQLVLLSEGGFVIVNEQMSGSTTNTADVVVNALHIVVVGAGANIVIGSASAGITCGAETGQTSSCGDFVTGGGWITGTPSGAKANFGVAGGIKDGAFWGHLNYIDHGSGIHVKATAVTGYKTDPEDSDCRIIDYDVTIDGQPGSTRS